MHDKYKKYIKKDKSKIISNILKKRILVLDGAMGTELLKLGLKLPLPLWSAIANEGHYKKVVEIHKNYIEGGCDVITTNTFRTSYRSYKKAKVKDALIRSNNSFKKAIKAALEAKGKKDILIAGSNAPLEDCYEPNLFPGEKVAEIEFMEILENFNIEDDTPELFNSEESVVSEVENESNEQEFSSFAEKKEEEDDLEIPAFLRRQKN